MIHFTQRDCTQRNSVSALLQDDIYGPFPPYSAQCLLWLSISLLDSVLCSNGLIIMKRSFSCGWQSAATCWMQRPSFPFLALRPQYIIEMTQSLGFDTENIVSHWVYRWLVWALSTNLWSLLCLLDVHPRSGRERQLFIKGIHCDWLHVRPRWRSVSIQCAIR